MIYLDSCILIYALENTGPLGDRARELLALGGRTFVLSPLVVLEALVWPMRIGDEHLRSQYESAFAEFTMIEFELYHYLHAAELRADSPGLKTVDALHLAGARLAGCEALWTNDKRLTAASAGLAVDVIGDSPA